MKESFDLNRTGKRMPYTAPEGFLDDIENNVWETVKGDIRPEPKRILRLIFSVAGGLVAASLAALLVFNFLPYRHDADTFAEIEQAFSELNSADRAYLLMIYQSDLFINN